jgi:hypothetical protein
MKILKFSEYNSKKLSQYESNNIEATSLNKDIASDKEMLIQYVDEIAGSASEAGIEIQIIGEEILKGKPIVKVLINEIEHNFSLEGNLLKINTLDGGLLDNVKGTSDKILNILIGKNPRRFYTSE